MTSRDGESARAALFSRIFRCPDAPLYLSTGIQSNK